VGILLNFFKSSILNQSAGDMLYGMAVGLMMMGRWMLHSSPNLVILISGMVMLLVGSITYARRVFNAYLWY
jgi:membrane-bound ClpP family serine protease